jgi:hypothetical protein
MGTTMLFQVPGSLFNIAQLLKIWNLANAAFQGQRHLSKEFARDARAHRRCKTTPCAAISG